ncbi:MAG: hypothetical protein E6G56_08330 [Actinobacteria bacterium]|nr:MAG: hypothetical protein E6G56_08330 [Actinomycetota bacterium]
MALVLAGLAVALGAGCGGGGGKSEAGAPGRLGSSGQPSLQSAGTASGYTPSGQLVADSGFRPDQNGFPFENYGGDVGAQDLGPAQMKDLFGDQVCANQANGQCTLSPPAQAWMNEVNKSMAGGHCMGFSVASLQLYKQQLKAPDFGASNPVSLSIGGNTGLQQRIAEDFAYQYLDKVKSAAIKGTPNEILDKLTEVLKSGDETYTLGFFKKDGSGGHAVTPYAIEDKGNGKFAVLIYDNNYPKTVRAMDFDRNANSFSYNGSPNPAEAAGLYEGDPSSPQMILFPTSAGQGTQPCPFCMQGGGGQATSDQSTDQSSQSSDQSSGTEQLDQGSEQAGKYYTVTLAGTPDNHANLVIEDDQGNQTGFINGKLVEDIDGVQVVDTLADQNWLGGEEPNYEIPLDKKVTITIDGSSLNKGDSETMTMTGPGYNAVVDDIKVNPGQKDTFEVSPDGSEISYTTDPQQTESPAIALGFQEQGPDYAFAVAAGDIVGGSTISVMLDRNNHELTVDTAGTKAAGTYALDIQRIDENATQEFKHEHLQLNPDEQATLNYGSFTEHGQSLPLSIKDKSGQQRQETLTD